MLFLPKIQLSEEQQKFIKEQKRELGESVEDLKGFAKNVGNFAVNVLRGWPRSGASLTLYLTGKSDFTPKTQEEKFFLGQEKVLPPEEMGQEFLKDIGFSEENIEKYGAPLGWSLVALDITDVYGGGKVKKEVAEEVAEQIIKKYGDDIGKQVIKQGDVFAKKALLDDGAEFVAGFIKRGETTIKSIVNKLTDAINKAEPARKKTEVLRATERARRAAIASGVLEEEVGEEAFKKVVGALRGELPKAEFKLPVEFAQKEVDILFDAIRIHEAPAFDFYAKLNTSTGLSKLLGGEIPTPSELTLLKAVFGEDLVNATIKKKGVMKRFGELFTEVVNVPRSLMSSMDMSAPLRQGLVLSIHKPKLAIPAFADMIKMFGSEKIFKASLDDILNKELYPLMRESGLFLADLTGKLGDFSKKEEAFMSNLADKIPILGRLVKASERAYVGFLNKLRADVFDNIAKEYMKGGIDPKTSSKVFKDLADFVNTSTGRGSLGKFSQAAPLLNGVFFSPRFVSARLKMLNPKWYMSLSPPVRKEAAKSMVKFVGTGLAILSLAQLGGAEVENDPISSDFGKIKIGNTRMDIWGGFQQWIRFTAQIIAGEIKSATTGKVRSISEGKDFPFTNRLDWAERFAIGKLAPIPALIADLLRGETMMGEPVTLQKSFYEKMTPLYIQDLIEASNELSMVGVIGIGLPAFFGVGTQTFEARRKEISPSALPVLPKFK